MFKKPEFALSSKPRPKRRGRFELTEEQKQEIKEAFDLFDTDGVGNSPTIQDTLMPRNSRLL